jgi:two-component system sensor histidine kinase DesK
VPATSPSPWLSRRRRVGLSALFLVYLLYVGLSVGQYSHGLGRAAGYLVIAAFCVTYLVIADRGPALGDRQVWMLLGLLGVLMIAELPFARAPAFTMCLYITSILVGRNGAAAWPLVLLFALAALLVPLAFPGWHDTLLDDIDYVTPIAVPVIALVTLGLRQITTANVALAEARAEVARLGAEAERARIARDLHDLLGHSLTAITVKAGLAHRIGPVDPERAFEEIAAVESLARRSLQDVRAAVAGYRVVTLAGELAAGRELLRAAGVAAAPGAWGAGLDAVDPDHQELFGWVVREGLTNVVRHARASSCAIRVSRCCVEITDDGLGPRAVGATANGTRAQAPGGHGLAGLRERVASAGGGLEAGPCSPAGWRLRVWLPGEPPR